MAKCNHYLDGNKITDKGVVTIMDDLKVNATIKHLSLCINIISSESNQRCRRQSHCRITESK